MSGEGVVALTQCASTGNLSLASVATHVMGGARAWNRDALMQGSGPSVRVITYNRTRSAHSASVPEGT
jgi:hypothetical protein